MAPKTHKFINIVSEGGMLPVDILARIHAQDSSLPGLNARDYHLDAGDRLSDAIARSWGPLRARWETFTQERNKFSLDERGTSATRERWLLPLFAELGFGRLAANKAEEIQGKSYPISHIFNDSPIHLVGCAINLDEKKAGVAGAARNSPHSLIQEYLNRSSDKLWGFVSNGLILRIVRDNVSLTRQSFVEFDLEGIFESQSFADFALLWLLCHHSRVESDSPSSCWLEQWAERARTEGTRALDNLRAGVEKAIVAFGAGFLEEKNNSTLREKLRSGALSKDDYYRELLRLIYRLIFLFVAEDRELLLVPEANNSAKERFKNFYSSARLRELSTQIRGTHHTDLFKSLKILFFGLGSDSGNPELGLPALGSFLWSLSATQNLDSCELSNFSLLEAFRALTTVVDGRVRRQVDYKNLGSEELGSIYESLLELHPEINTDAGHFELSTAAGNERKTSGSYYTPTSLINCLLDSALEPVVEEALKQERSEKAILNLKVCDPACGSGHFLIAAAHRLAKHLASIRTGETEPPPQATRHALRDVVGHCIYGVDINPMAVELCKVGLWLEALEPGKPLTFLEHRIQCGNSLLGATPALLENGIPDDAFEPIEGDDKKVCSALKKRNKKEREHKNQVTLFGEFEAWDRLGNIAAFINTLDDIDDSSIEGIQKKQKLYEEQVKGKNYLFSRFWADAWCAAFVWRKTSDVHEVLTEEVFRRIERNPHTVSPFIHQETQKIAIEYKFFHWHLAFPEVFRIPKKGERPENEQKGWSGGFDVLLGNPPWERLQFEERDFLQTRASKVASEISRSKRRNQVRELEANDSGLFLEWQNTARRIAGEAHYIRKSSQYPLAGKDKFNLYAVFTELVDSLAKKINYSWALILKAGIVTDELCSDLFEHLSASQRLWSVIEFENKLKIFTEVHPQERFALVTAGAARLSARFSFNNRAVLSNEEQYQWVELNVNDIKVISPSVFAIPKVSTSKELVLLRNALEFLGTPVDSKPSATYRMRIERFINVSDFSDSIRKISDFSEPCPNTFSSTNEWAPLYEGKLFSTFDYKFATYRMDGTVMAVPDSQHVAQPLTFGSFIKNEIACRRNPGLSEATALLAVRDLTNKTNERGIISAIIPPAATDYTVRIVSFENFYSPNVLLYLCAAFNSLAFDFFARMRIGGTHVTNQVILQSPFPSYWTIKEETRRKIEINSLRLSYIGAELELFAQSTGYETSPSWENAERTLLRAELDALFFHLYKINFEDVNYILEQFPVLKSKEEREFGEYRTKRLVLEEYDRLAKLDSREGRKAAK